MTDEDLINQLKELVSKGLDLDLYKFVATLVDGIRAVQIIQAEIKATKE